MQSRVPDTCLLDTNNVQSFRWKLWIAFLWWVEFMLWNTWYELSSKSLCKIWKRKLMGQALRLVRKTLIKALASCLGELSVNESWHSSFLPTCRVKGWLKSWGPCHPSGRPPLSCGLLNSALALRKWTKRWGCFLSLSSLSVFVSTSHIVNKQVNKR